MRRGREGRVNYLVLLIGLVIAVPLGAVLVLSFGRNPREVPFMLQDQPAPDFRLTTLDGSEQIALDDLRGKKVVINFWSTWCGPCKIEHPVLLAAAKRWPDAAFVGVLYQDEPAKALSYLKREGTSYPHLFDPTGTLSIDYGVAGVPETYFVSEEGVIVYKHIGPVSWELMQSFLGAP